MKKSLTAREYVTTISAGFPDSRVQSGSTLLFIDAIPGIDDDEYIFYNDMWEVIPTPETAL